MRQGIWRSSPALVISALALFVALGGSVYAAKKPRVDGKTIRVKSIPGNRVKLRSIPANRLKPGVLQTAPAAAGTPLTGADIVEHTLGQVPSAVHANTADFANSALDAETAENAINALDAKTVNGHSAGCMPGTLLFAGACWESDSSTAATAPVAAIRCAERGAALPDALQLAAFAEQPGVTLHADDEWSSDVTAVSGPGVYAVATVAIDTEVNMSPSTTPHPYRCVVPLLR